jgi:hypothetical protein
LKFFSNYDDLLITLSSTMLITDGALSSWHIKCFLEDDFAPDSWEGVDYFGVFETPPPF